jgi:dolichyl-phosphate beta-glucosyltransferase
MADQLDLSVVIPAFNEEGRLAPTVGEVVRYCRERSFRFEVIVVDDGSRDGTSALVRLLTENASEVRLIRLAANQGKGYAVRTGILNSRGRLVIFADADGAAPFGEIERLEAAIAGGADAAIGSRVVPGQGTAVRAKWYRRIIGRAFHALVELLTVRGFRDTQCGFKLFRGSVAQDLFSRMRMNGFSFDIEVLVMAQRQGYRVAEVPINWSHQPGSRVSLVFDSARMAYDLFTIRAHAARGDYGSPHVARLVETAPPPAT